MSMLGIYSSHDPPLGGPYLWRPGGHILAARGINHKLTRDASTVFLFLHKLGDLSGIKEKCHGQSNIGLEYIVNIVEARVYQEIREPYSS